MKNKVVKILLLVSPLLIGIGSSLLVKDMSLTDIKTPILTPPAIVFPIAWTILYVLMGIGAMLIYSSKDNEDNKNMGLIFHCIQLIFNFFWSIIFFNLKQYLFALVWLVLLWLTVVSMLKNYKKVNKTAFVLNIPYIAWLTFAGYLNLMIFVLN